MLEAIAGTALVMLVYAVFEEEAPKFRRWLVFRRLARSLDRTARAFSDLAEKSKLAGKAIEMSTDAFQSRVVTR